MLIASALLLSQSDSPLNTLPQEMRPEGSAILQESRDPVRADLARTLARKNNPAALEFLLDLAEHDPSPVVRRSLIDRLSNVIVLRFGPCSGVPL